MTLAEAEIDKEYVILNVYGKQKQRLETLGFIRDSIVSVSGKNWCGIVVQLLDSRVALSIKASSSIEVRPRMLHDFLKK